MRHSLAVFLLFTLVACSSDPAKEDNYTADELYAQAQESLQDKAYEKAIKQLETLQSRFPYGRHAQQSQMEIAYAYFKHEEPEAALAAIDRFVKQYPNSATLDYMFYLKGLIHFNENINSMLGTWFSQDPAERDPASMRDAFDAFKELITRFPDSRYAEDSRVRMQYLLNTLANSEIHAASYYLRRGAYVAAVNRAKVVLTSFPQSPQTRDALQIMVQAYGAMGMPDLQKDTQRILDLNVSRDGVKPVTREMPQTGQWWKFWS
jgi:outer membrane protein assembly factor BamD